MKICLLLLIGSLTASCNALDLGPEDIYSINNYWNSAEQCERFMIGLHYRVRERAENMLLMGAVFVWMFCAFWKKEILGNVDITFSFLVAVPLCILCMQCAAVQKCLEFPIFRWMGKISYSIYIWNFPVQIVFLGVAEVFGAIEFSSPGIWFLNFGVTVMTAYISYKKVECKEQILWDIVKEKK